MPLRGACCVPDSANVRPLMWKPAFLATAVVIASQASAEPCVKIRDGTDGTGPSGGYACMEFSQPQRGAAAKLHLRLGSSYKVVQTKMVRNGWVLDPEWLSLFEADVKRGLPVCGQGWDAICHIEMRKGNSSVVLTFSGTNNGDPLISVKRNE
jgi:hypothetical protein